MARIKDVAIIGGGAAGLCSARHLLHHNKGIPLKPVVFESKSAIGGTWLYEEVDRNQPGKVFSSIYANLRTNLPKQVMMFPNFSYPDSLPSYMAHTDVLEYLRLYAKHYNLNDLVRYDTEVVNIRPLLHENIFKWCVTSSNSSTQDITEEEYDAVVVCNGHYSIPSYPSISGLKNFKGEMLHSHYYRHPEEFSGKVVLILGRGPSALDILAELSNYCKTVYFSHRGDRVSSVLPQNVIEVPSISHVTDCGQFVFEDSGVAKVDVFLPCTGYLLNFPFLPPETGIVLADNTVKDLYKHIFNIRYPSLAFVGLTWQNTPFPAMHQQCQYIAKVIAETVQLPSSTQMLEDTEKERLERLSSGQLGKYFHRMGDRQWGYSREIAVLADNEENPPIIENMYKYAMQFRNADFCMYKKMQFEALNDKEFVDVTKSEHKISLGGKEKSYTYPKP